MTHDESPRCPRGFLPRWRLLLFAAAQLTLYTVIAALSPRFAYDSPHGDRPLLLVVGLFGLCFALHLASLRDALRIDRFRELAWIISVGSVAFRLPLALSYPIQEVDIYRYAWDGATISQGVNPYRFSPRQVLEVLDANAPGSEPAVAPEELIGLADLCRARPAIGEIARRVHYAELTTVYPPVSECFFAAAHVLTPDSLSVWGRITVLKLVLIGFDLATVGGVWLLLRTATRHPAWTIAYAWCPLVLREFANGGHLDAIAVFFSVAAILTSVRLVIARTPLASDGKRERWSSVASGVLLAMSVGAKLYAVVLAPLLLLVLARKRGWRVGAAFAAAFSLVTVLALAPMIRTTESHQSSASEEESAAPSGLAAFLSRWEMNDFLFLIVYENTRPTAETTDASTDVSDPWFAIVPKQWTGFAVERIAQSLNVEHHRAAFLLARFVTAIAFLVLAMWFACRAARIGSVGAFLESTFLTVAWFWLLSPTQNPWYWTWALPLVPFARGRAWLAMSGLLFAYYLRFWLLYQFAEGRVAGTVYGPAQYFDFVVTWLEFGPWFLVLAFVAVRRTALANAGLVDAVRATPGT